VPISAPHPEQDHAQPETGPCNRHGLKQFLHQISHDNPQHRPHQKTEKANAFTTHRQLLPVCSMKLFAVSSLTSASNPGASIWKPLRGFFASSDSVLSDIVRNPGETAGGDYRIFIVTGSGARCNVCPQNLINQPLQLPPRVPCANNLFAARVCPPKRRNA
jgi:hypothetical protein